MIAVSNLTKTYGAKNAVDSLSFSASTGVLGFLGPNGAGKSTTMNIITGYIGSSSGEVTVDSADIQKDPKKAKRSIGYLPELPPLYLDMTVDEYLSFVYNLKGVKHDFGKIKHLDNICELTQVYSVRQRLIKNLSKGYKQRVGLAAALIGDPENLILDEPTVGLDPNQIIEIRNLIKSFGKTRTVILSSHILSEIQSVCDRVIIISKGKLVADSTLSDLTHQFSDKNNLVVHIEGPKGAVMSELASISSIKKVEERATDEPIIHEYSLSAGTSDIRREVWQCCVANNFPLLMMKTGALTLEEIFLKLTQ